MPLTKLNSQAIPPNTIVESDLSYPLTNFSSTGIDDNADALMVELHSFGTTPASHEIRMKDQMTVRDSVAIGSTGNVTLSLEADEIGLNGSGPHTWSVQAQNTGKLEINSPTGAGSQLLVIDTAGNVGINESAPDELLHVQGPDEVVIKIEATGSQAPLYDGTPKLQLVPMATNGFTGEAIIEASAPSSLLSSTGMWFRAAKSQSQISGSYVGGSFTFHDGNQIVCNISDTGIQAPTFQSTSGGATALTLSSTGRVTTGENLEVANDLTVTGTSTLNAVNMVGATTFDLAVTGTSTLVTVNASGNLHCGDGTDITMDSSANGQLQIDGNAYMGAIAMDASSMYVYHNSSSRNLVLGTNETARLTINGTGTAATFSPLIVGRNCIDAAFNTANDDGSISIRGDSEYPAVMSFHRTGAYAVNFGLDGSNMKLGGWSAVTTKFIWEMANGNFHADGNIIAYSTSASDERFKDDVQPITGALDTVDALRGVTFTWNAGSREGKRDYGLIAQEVEKVLPELVHESALPMMTDDEETQYKTLDYEKLCAVLISAVSELRAEVEELRASRN